MKHLFLPALLLLLGAARQATATNISGIVYSNTTLTKANSPYIVDANYLVYEGATLTIEPGVEIRVDSGVYFYVDGTLRAIGTYNDPIRFTANIIKPGMESWDGIEARHEGNTDSIILDYCDISHAKNGLRANVVAVNVTNSTFTNCGYGIRMEWATVHNILQSKFKHCYTGIMGGKQGTIYGCEMAHCNMGVYQCDGDFVNNLVHDNVTGLKIYGGSVSITNNTFVNNGTGMYMSPGIYQVPVHGNVVAYNTTGMYINQVKAEVKNNSIKHNKTGMKSVWNMTGLQFKNNCIDSNTSFNLEMTGDVDQDFSNNYWGSTDSATLHTRMLDFYDDFKTAKAIIFPCLASPDINCKDYTGPVVTHIPDPAPEKRAAVWPNPFSSSFTIALQGLQAVSVEVYNVTGQRIIAADAAGRNEVTIDMQAYPAGIYQYRILHEDNKAETGKLLKQQ